MRKKLSYITSFVVLLVLFWTMSEVLVSHADRQPASIQALIDKANQGDLLVIPEGTYEEALTITKPLILQAEGVIIQNNGLHAAIHVQADQVVLSGMTIYQLNEASDQPALLVEGDYNTIKEIKIRSMTTGVKLNQANRNILSSIHIEREAPIDLTAATMGNRQGNGIDLLSSHQNTIEGNTIINQLDGIYLEASVANTIEFNNVIRSRYGYHLMAADDSILTNNFASFNITGAMLMGSKRLSVTNNTFAKQAYHVYSQGMLLHNIEDSSISDNLLAENLIGLYAERSSGNQIFNNQLSANFVGIQLNGVANNDIYQNDFLVNVLQARVTASSNNNVYHNYWDTHSGLDFTGDGISELSYEADPIFLALVERKPAFQLFSQSPGLAFLQLLLDMNDQEILKDTAPFLEPYAGSLADKREMVFKDILSYSVLLLGGLLIITGGIKKS